MRRSDRWLWAIVLVLVDALVVVVPVTAILAAYLIVARPPWFRRWVEELYREP